MCEKTVTERIVKVGELTRSQAKEQIKLMEAQGEFLTITEYHKALKRWLSQD